MCLRACVCVWDVPVCVYVSSSLSLLLSVSLSFSIYLSLLFLSPLAFLSPLSLSELVSPLSSLLSRSLSLSLSVYSLYLFSFSLSPLPPNRVHICAYHNLHMHLGYVHSAVQLAKKKGSFRPDGKFLFFIISRLTCCVELFIDSYDTLMILFDVVQISLQSFLCATNDVPIC